MKTFKFTISGNTYEAEIKSFEDTTAEIEINGTSYSVEVHREVKKTKTPTLVRAELPPSDKGDIEKREKGSTEPVVAPLPGTIIEIMVKPGDMIKKGQVILVMEAMKMENRIRAEKEGVVESVNVNRGSSVLQGDILIEMV
ncbi:MAG: biotin/lipoyl-binding protein [Marinilabiliales bacterium]|nr:MAG: biotin/lipoyl-binding protein [Marinilabiliales bacterium]